MGLRCSSSFIFLHLCFFIRVVSSLSSTKSHLAAIFIRGIIKAWFSTLDWCVSTRSRSRTDPSPSNFPSLSYSFLPLSSLVLTRSSSHFVDTTDGSEVEVARERDGKKRIRGGNIICYHSHTSQQLQAISFSHPVRSFSWTFFIAFTDHFNDYENCVHMTNGSRIWIVGRLSGFLFHCLFCNW